MIEYSIDKNKICKCKFKNNKTELSFDNIIAFNSDSCQCDIIEEQNDSKYKYCIIIVTKFSSKETCPRFYSDDYNFLFQMKENIENCIICDCVINE